MRVFLKEGPFDVAGVCGSSFVRNGSTSFGGSPVAENARESKEPVEPSEAFPLAPVVETADVPAGTCTVRYSDPRLFEAA